MIGVCVCELRDRSPASDYADSKIVMADLLLDGSGVMDVVRP
jgi:hypothetical protein